MLEWLFGKKKEEPKQEQKPKKKKTKAEQQTEDKWMYDFLVQFLNSPLWRVSLLDFVDQKCIVFDNEEENKFQYTTIHNQFKQLVAGLFDGMMQEVGLDQDKLVELLERGFESKQRKLFNQLLLCDDFLKFKDLMLRRNKALEQEALKALQGSQVHHRKSKIEKQRDIVYQSQKLQEERRKKIQEQQEAMFRKALQMSKIQAQEREAIDKLEQKTSKIEKNKKVQEDAQRQKVEAQEKKKMQHKRMKEEEEQRQRQERQREEERQRREKEQAEKLQQQDKKKRDEERKKQLRAKLKKKKDLEPIGQKTQHEQSNLSDLPPLRGTQKIAEIEEKKQQEPVQPVQQIVQQQPKKEESKVESQEDRKKRLLQQRQKIRKKKEEERKKMLEQAEPQHKTMNIVLQDEGIHDSVRPEPEKEPEEKVSKDQIQRRKELMKRIKNRIVDDF